jgi:hypothetical protein
LTSKISLEYPGGIGGIEVGFVTGGTASAVTSGDSADNGAEAKVSSKRARTRIVKAFTARDCLSRLIILMIYI